MAHTIHLALACALLAQACAYSSVPHAFEARGFSPAEVEVIRDAAAQWSDAGYPTIVTTDACDGCSVIRSVHRLRMCGSVAGVQHCIDAPATSLAMTQYDSGLDSTSTADADHYGVSILAHRGETPEWYAARGVEDNLDYVHQMALHELGHTWGREHGAPGTAMCAHIDCMSHYLTAADVAP